MDANFNVLLEEIRGGSVEILKLWNNNIGDDGARALSIALVNTTNKVISIDLSWSNLRNDGISAL